LTDVIFSKFLMSSFGGEKVQYKGQHRVILADTFRSGQTDNKCDEKVK